MPGTNFIDHNTVITAVYMNYVDAVIFDAIGDGTAAPTTPAEVKTNLGLDNVNNTTDLNKPISTATQTALDDIDTALGLKAATATTVQKDSNTGAAQLPVGTTAQQPVTAAAGMFRFNDDTDKFEGHNGTVWGSVGGGATGAGGDEVFIENGVTVTTDYTISTGKNALSVGPITIDSGVDVTIPSGQRWVVL